MRSADDVRRSAANDPDMPPASELPVTIDRPEPGSEGPPGDPELEPDVNLRPPAPRVRPRPEHVIDFFRRHLGLAEDPPGSNRTWIGAWYGVNGVPWCAMTTSRALVEGGFSNDGETCNLEQAYGIRQTTARGWAYVPYMRAAFREARRYDWKPRVGDLVIFDWDGDGIGDHIGALEQDVGDGTYVCLEGNTSHNVLERRRRPGSLIAGFCHPPYDGAPVPDPGGRPPRQIQTPGCLRRGDWGPEVEALQRRLVELGYHVEVDGIFGPQTEAAVRQLQQQAGIEVDGIVGAETQRHLTPRPAGGGAAAPPWPGRYLRRGVTGEDVRTVQAGLKDRGWRLGADGSFGPVTEKVVIAFQRDKRLEVDGVVGPVTWNAVWTLPIS